MVPLDALLTAAMGCGKDRSQRQMLLKKLQEMKQGQTAKESRIVSIMDSIPDAYTWVTQFTQTWNEHWIEEGRESPYEAFPDFPYLAAVFQTLEAERIIWIEKSRDMMLSWSCVAYLTFNVMTVPERTALFQTQTEKKAIQLVEYAKCLYRRQNRDLREVFPLAKNVDSQSSLELQFANGSSIIGIPGGANQIRSYHPYAYFNDESSFQPDAGDCYNEALAAVKGKIIFNSSAGPGWYADARRDIVRSEEQ